MRDGECRLAHRISVQTFGDDKANTESGNVLPCPSHQHELVLCEPRHECVDLFKEIQYPCRRRLAMCRLVDRRPRESGPRGPTPFMRMQRERRADDWPYGGPARRICGHRRCRIRGAASFDTTFDLTLGLIIVLAAVSGHGVGRLWRGVLIDEYDRNSLSQF
jgi:hypothetical protein